MEIKDRIAYTFFEVWFAHGAGAVFDAGRLRFERLLDLFLNHFELLRVYCYYY